MSKTLHPYRDRNLCEIEINEFKKQMQELREHLSCHKSVNRDELCHQSENNADEYDIVNPFGRKRDQGSSDAPSSKQH